MTGLRVSITRYVSDQPQPGIVECEFADANGRSWLFVEKTAVVSTENLHARTSYPRRGIIACEILSSSQDATGRRILLVGTERPWGVESIDGSTRFQVLPSMLVTWEPGSEVELGGTGRSLYGPFHDDTR